MGLSFTDFHWGTRPSRRLECRVYCGPCRSMGGIKAVSYATVKDDRPDVWRHQFAAPLPVLLVCDPAGTIRPSEKPPAETIEIGRLVDIEIQDDDRVIFGLGYLVTSKEGKGLWVACEPPVLPLIAIAGGRFEVNAQGIVH